MNKKKLYEELMNMTADEIVERLEQEYKDDEDALQHINTAKLDIKYIKAHKDYAQTPKQYAMGLVDHLFYWY